MSKHLPKQEDQRTISPKRKEHSEGQKWQGLTETEALKKRRKSTHGRGAIQKVPSDQITTMGCLLT